MCASASACMWISACISLSKCIFKYKLDFFGETFKTSQPRFDIKEVKIWLLWENLDHKPVISNNQCLIKLTKNET